MWELKGDSGLGFVGLAHLFELPLAPPNPLPVSQVLVFRAAAEAGVLRRTSLLGTALSLPRAAAATAASV